MEIKYNSTRIVLLWIISLALCHDPYGLQLEYDLARYNQVIDADSARIEELSNSSDITRKFGSISKWEQPGCVGATNSDTRYCVYTCATCGNGQGIAIITPPEKSAALLDAAGDSIGQATSALGDVEPPFQMVTISSKGRAVVASSFIAKGTLIHAESPLLVYESQMWHDIEDDEPQQYLKGLAVDSLPETSRDALYDLYGWPSQESISDKLSTNSFGFLEDDGRQLGGIPRFLSKLSHDCRANAVPQFHRGKFAHELYAIRDIAPGEEITISYFETDISHAERHEVLNAQYGFQCACELCRAAPELIELSDKRIQKIKELQHVLKDESQVDSAHGLAMAELLVDLYREERLDTMIWNAYRIMAVQASRAGCIWRTLSAGYKALQYGFLAGAQDSEWYTSLQALVENVWQ